MLNEIFKRQFLEMPLKDFPMFDNIRNEPEFQEILKDVETKYQKEHERVGELLKKLGEIQ